MFWWGKGDGMKIIAYSLIGLIGLVLVFFFILGRKSAGGQAPGLVDGRLAPCSSKPNCVSSEDGTPGKKQVAPLSCSWDDLKSAITGQGGVITKDADGYLSAEFTSSIYKFVDDFEARLDGDKIQIRSASRVGYSDRGVNAKRVEALRAALGGE